VKTIIKVLLKLIFSPKAFYRLCIALMRGTLYIVWIRLFRKNIKIRFPFFCYSKVEISGNGKVFIDRGCAVWTNSFDHLVISTLSPEAEVNIGKRCTLGGLTIRCLGKVRIGDNVLTAATLIQDVPIVCAKFCTSSTKKMQKSQISIGNDTWLGAQSVVLAESGIGNGSVLGLNALLFKLIVEEGCLAVGNPAMRPIPIRKLNVLKSGSSV